LADETVATPLVGLPEAYRVCADELPATFVIVVIVVVAASASTTLFPAETVKVVIVAEVGMNGDVPDATVTILKVFPAPPVSRRDDVPPVPVKAIVEAP